MKDIKCARLDDAVAAIVMGQVIDPSVFCSGESTLGVNNHLICLAVWNIAFSVTAIVRNSLILSAFRKEG